jgi:hypothetical protein
MKKIKEKFLTISESFPNLSSLICFGRICRQMKLEKKQIRAGFRELVEKGDYERRDYENILKHLQKTLKNVPPICL